MPDIIESPVIKIVFRDHLLIWSLVLRVMAGGKFEGDEAVVSISLPKLLELYFYF